MTATQGELIGFVRKALARGIPRRQIRATLGEAGWSGENIDKALDAFAETDFPIPVPRPRPYVSPRESFLYLLLFSALFLSAYHLGAVLIELIDKALPDLVGPEYSEAKLRGSLAYVIVAFPLYLYMTLRQEREMRTDPTRRASPVRKWLTYLTLFFAAGFVVGDLVVLVRYFLDGELTLRFLLKVAVVGAIAGIVFAFYLYDIGRERE